MFFCHYFLTTYRLSSDYDNMLEQLLTQLGLNTKEPAVYLGVAELGRATAGAISKRCKMPRATVYLTLEALIERQVIDRERTHSSTLFFLRNPSSFLRNVESEKNALVEKERAAKEVIDLISPYLNNSEYAIPRLQFFEGRQKIENMLYEYLPEWRRSYANLKDWTLWGYQDHSFVEQYRRWHDHLWATANPKEHICLFSNPSDIEKELVYRVPQREVRPLPEGFQFSSSIWLYGDYILMAMTRQTPHYALHLKDAVFAANLRTIFQLLWRALPA